MKTVGIRELKNRLSAYVRAARSGETILVTDRGEVVAELVPPDRAAGDDGVPPRLLALVRSGQATLGARNQDAKYPTLRRLLRNTTAAALLDDERRER